MRNTRHNGYIEVKQERETNLLIMVTQQQRQKAENLLEDTFVEMHGRDQWKVTDIDGNILDRANTKTMALYLAACAEDKEEQILAI